MDLNHLLTGVELIRDNGEIKLVLVNNDDYEQEQ